MYRRSSETSRSCLVRALFLSPLAIAHYCVAFWIWGCRGSSPYCSSNIVLFAVGSPTFLVATGFIFSDGYNNLGLSSVYTEILFESA